MGKDKTFITLFVHILAVLFFSSCEEKTTVVEKIKILQGYNITGKTTLKDATYAYVLNNQKKDSVEIKNQTFSYHGEIKNPELFFIQLNNNLIKHPIIIENNTDYNILLDEYKSMIIGGDLNTKLFRYKHTKAEFDTKKADFHELYASKDINLRTYLNNIDSLRQKEKYNFTEFLTKNQNNILSSIALDQQSLSSKEVNQLIKLIDTVNSKSLVSQLSHLSKKLKIEEATKRISRRKQAPLFTGINLSGSKTSLASLMRNKKMFIIDFWASWCPPCRESSPELIKLYNTYHHKGFDILTVSEDRSVADWRNGVLVDDIDRWHHIYDDFNRISSMYNATALPHIVLIDENGKIIKNKISIRDLKKQLEQKFN